MKKTFSVVIPLYNKAQSVGETIRSVLNQTFGDFELIVVDDGSTDGSAQVVEAMSDPRILLVKKSNGGVSSARNAGIALASADHIAFLDADDLWLPSFLEEMAGLIRDCPEAGIWGAAYYQKVQGELTLENFCLPSEFRNYLASYFGQAIRHILFWSSAVVVKKMAFERIRNFNEAIHFGEDLDMWFRLALEYPTALFNKPLAVYNKDAENRAMRRKLSFEKNIIAHTEQYKQHEECNDDFKKFINLFRCIQLPEVFDSPGVTTKRILNYERLIDRASVPLRYRLYLILPVPLQRFVWRFLRLLRYGRIPVDR